MSSPAGSTPSRVPEVFLLVLTWNARQMVMDCLETVLEIDYEALRVVVIDNGGVDGTTEALRQRYGDRIHVIRIEHNIKFSRANNEGIRYALEHGADYVMLLNDDTTVQRDMIRELVKQAESSPDIGVVGPKIYYFEPDDQIWFAGGRVHLHRGTAEHVGIREIDRGQYDEVRDVDYITGAGLMIKRAVVERIGLLDRVYLAYYEDTDWCMRARRAGWRCVYVPRARMWHKISASTGGQLTRYKIFHKIRSGIIFYGRYARWYHALSIPLFAIADVFRVLRLVLAGRIRSD